MPACPHHHEAEETLAGAQDQGLELSVRRSVFIEALFLTVSNIPVSGRPRVADASESSHPPRARMT